MPRNDKESSPICAYKDHGAMRLMNSESDTNDDGLSFSSHCLMTLATRNSDNQLVLPTGVVFSVDIYSCTKCGYIELYNH